jgi:hypothetical protein
MGGKQSDTGWRSARKPLACDFTASPPASAAISPSPAKQDARTEEAMADAANPRERTAPVFHAAKQGARNGQRVSGWQR